MRVLLLLAVAGLTSPLAAQQFPDTAFSVPNTVPVFQPGEGPTICVDEGHNNTHTLPGSYGAFGRLVEGDGFVARPYAHRFSIDALGACDVLVVVNALARENALKRDSSWHVDRAWLAEAWKYPHRSAFDRDDIEGLLEWVRSGGRLLLIVDHAPFAGAANSIAAPLGVLLLNGIATYGRFVKSTDQPMDEPFTGRLGDHPIVEGRRGVDAAVEGVLTFGGTAFFPSEAVEGLLHLAPDAYGNVSPRFSGEDQEWPTYPLKGWLAGGAFAFGRGRVVVLGEAAMCSAQLKSPENRPMGMNHPGAEGNAHFCLNTIRWLVGVL